MLTFIPQNLAYHNFADNITQMGIPHFWNVMSNLAFILAGYLGMNAMGLFSLGGKCGGDRSHDVQYYAWCTFFVGVFLTGFGSGYYHLNPNNFTLIFDRLPMTIAFMGMLSAISADYGFRQFKLIPSVAFGLFSVLYWAIFDDLIFYVVVQFASLLFVAYLLIGRKTPYTSKVPLVYGLSFYGFAKICEDADVAIFKYFFLSGHTLKHIAAAIGCYFVVLHCQSVFKSSRRER